MNIETKISILSQFSQSANCASNERSIVTADVYRGFSRELAPPSLTLRHWSGLRPYTSPFGFAEPCVFVKQSLETLSLRPLLFKLKPTCNCQFKPKKEGEGILHSLRPAFLPSSLEIVYSIALVYSTSPPVSVCGTVKFKPYDEHFLES